MLCFKAESQGKTQPREVILLCSLKDTLNKQAEPQNESFVPEEREGYQVFSWKEPDLKEP